MSDIKEWHKIGDTLCRYLKICSCQRKLKSIVDELWFIYQEEEKFREDRDYERKYTGSDWLLWAMIDSRTTGIVYHGVNCEYPIVYTESEFWQFIKEAVNNPNLEDN